MRFTGFCAPPRPCRAGGRTRLTDATPFRAFPSPAGATASPPRVAPSPSRVATRPTSRPCSAGESVACLHRCRCRPARDSHGLPILKPCACRFPSRGTSTSKDLDTSRNSRTIRCPASRAAPSTQVDRSTCKRHLTLLHLRRERRGHLTALWTARTSHSLPLSRTVAPSEEKRAVDSAVRPSTEVVDRIRAHLPVRTASPAFPAPASCERERTPESGVDRPRHRVSPTRGRCS